MHRMNLLTQPPNKACLELDLAGQVQGVGLRPMLFRLAQSLDLTGLIFNHETGARAELDGPVDQLEKFCIEVQRNAQSPVIIRELRKHLTAARGFHDLRVVQRPVTQRAAFTAQSLSLPPDIATCVECWRDFFDVKHRLFLYPFISCSTCGPRWSILQQLPFERASTTLHEFPLCQDCVVSYEDPVDRRFHAQTLSCPKCGPRLTLLTNANTTSMLSADVISNTKKLLREGAVGLIKGIGGFQLVGNALDSGVIARIRDLKSRPNQALAIMINNMECFLEIGGTSLAWQCLTSAAAPIGSFDEIRLSTRELLAPDLRELGVMAPTCGLHYLLGESASPLVVTSGNRKGSPLPRDLSEISFEIGRHVDFILDHNRKIAHGLDDSVVRGELILRKARGLAPQIWPRRQRTKSMPTIVALGADMKNSAAIAYNDIVVELPYAGELGDVTGLERQRQEIQDVLDLLHLKPVCASIDIHPASLTGYLCPQGVTSTQVVPHHLAHAFAVAQSFEVDLILTFDGTGLNGKGELKGGEGYLCVDHSLIPRLSLRASPLVGGDTSIRFPWRAAVAMLATKNFPMEKIQVLFPEVPVDHLTTIMTLSRSRSLGTMCSSLGRWFDAAAAIVEFGSRETSYEAQGPIRLENLAEYFNQYEALPDCVNCDDQLTEVDGSALLVQLAQWRLNGQFSTGALAFLAHDQMARAMARAIFTLRIRSVVGTGGVFQNEVFFARLKHHLEAVGIALSRPHDFPVNDQSIALGQLAYLNWKENSCTSSV
jgi:hydrogenase maturation protein HypF